MSHVARIFCTPAVFGTLQQHAQYERFLIFPYAHVTLQHVLRAIVDFSTRILLGNVSALRPTCLPVRVCRGLFSCLYLFCARIEEVGDFASFCMHARERSRFPYNQHARK